MRADGLEVQKPFYVLQLYDREGYYGSVKGRTLEELKVRAARRTSQVQGLLATSLPYPGTWAGPHLPDVSLPAEWKAEMAALDKGRDE
jgi:hypothetical protein